MRKGQVSLEGAHQSQSATPCGYILLREGGIWRSRLDGGGISGESGNQGLRGRTMVAVEVGPKDGAAFILVQLVVEEMSRVLERNIVLKRRIKR